MPNLYLLSMHKNEYGLNSVEKLNPYHENLDGILESTMQVNDQGGIPFEFSYCVKQYNVMFKLFMMCVIGDTKGHDKLCA